MAWLELDQGRAGGMAKQAGGVARTGAPAAWDGWRCKEKEEKKIKSVGPMQRCLFTV
jgi:hypothetical protein